MVTDKQKVYAARIQKLEGNIDHVLDSMNNQVKDLKQMLDMLKNQWRGLGGAQFHNLQEDINQRHDALQSLMKHIREAVTASRKGASANDEEIRGSLGKIDVNGSDGGKGMVGGSYNEKYAGFASSSKLDAM
ncbi:WXG100 family type VII secretion target [Streptomyces olivaceiscleroticus]|uniref:WXG100 family type VII secretion target n=1 Tax=Streptomyces olivaceiscleroticus TaxID=68245 RepID=A0ABN0ZV02_9ACTN